MEPLLFATLSAIAGLLGGWLAFSKRIKPDLAYGFTAGTLIGLAAFSLIPEIFELNKSASIANTWVMALLVAGFLSIHIIEKLVVVHEHEGKYRSHTHPYVGLASAVVLVGHSFFDGLSIGVAYQVNTTFGLAVAIAVIGHRFADGFNIASLVKKNGGHRSKAALLVALGALAPIAGVVLALFVDIPTDALLAFLGFFTGLILYIGASDILPQAHSKASSRTSLLFTLLGVVFMYFVSQVA